MEKKSKKEKKSKTKTEKILVDKKEEKTEEELQKEEEQRTINEIGSLKNASDSMKAKLITLNLFKTEIEKLKHIKLNSESNDLQDKYEPKYYEYYNLISDVISATSSEKFINKITDEDYIKYDIKKEEDSSKELEIKYDPIKNFWAETFENSEYFILKGKDKEILQYLSGIHSYLTKIDNIITKQNDNNLSNNNDNVNITTNNNGDYSFIYEIIFYFEENEYFNNRQINKVYYYNKKNTQKLEKVDFPIINWKQGHEPNNSEDSFFDMFIENKCKKEESESEAEYIRNNFFPNLLEFYMNFKDDSEADDYDNYI